MLKRESKTADESTLEEEAGSPTDSISLESASALEAASSLDVISSLEEDCTSTDSEDISGVTSSGDNSLDGCCIATSTLSSEPCSFSELPGLPLSPLQAENTATSKLALPIEMIFFRVIANSTYIVPV